MWLTFLIISFYSCWYPGPMLAEWLSWCPIICGGLWHLEQKTVNNLVQLFALYKTVCLPVQSQRWCQLTVPTPVRLLALLDFLLPTSRASRGGGRILPVQKLAVAVHIRWKWVTTLFASPDSPQSSLHAHQRSGRYRRWTWLCKDAVDGFVPSTLPCHGGSSPNIVSAVFTAWLTAKYRQFGYSGTFIVFNKKIYSLVMQLLLLFLLLQVGSNYAEWCKKMSAMALLNCWFESHWPSRLP